MNSRIVFALVSGLFVLTGCVTNEQVAREASWEAYKRSTYERLGEKEGMKALAKSLGMTVEEFKKFDASGGVR